MNFEWLPFSLPRTLTLRVSGSSGVASDIITVSRNEDLKLIIESDAPGGYELEEKVIPGTRSIGATLPLISPRGEISGYKRTGQRTESKGERKHSYVNGQADALSVVYSLDDKIECGAMTEWVVNMPQRLWGRSTERQKIKTSRRQRDDSKMEDTSEVEMGGTDHICLKLDLPTLESVLVGTVPREFVEDMFKPAGPGFIEYRRGPAGLPDDSLRRTVVRAMEFLLGSGLGVLGRSEFSADGRVLRAEFSSAYIPGGAGSGHRPALLHPQGWLDGLDETIIAPILKRFIELEQSYSLNRAIWLYLHGRSSPLEMAAGYLGAGFEILRRSYYEQPDNEKRSRLMPKDRWQIVGRGIRDLFASLAHRESLSDLSNELHEVEIRLGELNRVSGKKLSKLFFADLGLQYGEIEERALQARDDAAHAMPYNVTEGFEKLKAYRALQTLFARVLLRLLSAQVYYFDYSAEGHPLRRIHEQQGPRTTER